MLLVFDFRFPVYTVLSFKLNLSLSLLFLIILLEIENRRFESGYVKPIFLLSVKLN